MTRSSIPTSNVLTVEFDGHVATIWLDRPEKRNAFAPEFWNDLPGVMEALGDDDETRAIVIAAKGQSFTVGIDLKAFGPVFMSGGVDPDDPNPPTSDVGRRRALYQSVKRLQQTFTAIAECPKPVIAAIHGHCIGAGIDLITACDIRIATTDAIFSVRETKIAMVADVGTLQRLPRIINPGHVADVVFTGRDFTAQEATTMGLVTRVLSDVDALHKSAATIAAEIASNSPLAVQGAKAVLAAEAEMSIDEALDHIALWNAAFIQSNDFVEAVMAFMAKRPPEFTGE
ncbi:MAG: crotonase/enoyl-CoA hydratase family protein [Actinomycetia bacterium]|nr:crotonase/enoyl-CoA hydratase family protein [Actinomycetes bacterium]